VLTKKPRAQKVLSDEIALLGGNGILLENHIGRFVADAEAIYSYDARPILARY
jgi:alkylation response protein AidB-like acyl-CoA dehydrogenase